MLAQFLKGIRPLVLRRLKSEVAKELPDKLDQVLILPMDDQARKYLYFIEKLLSGTAKKAGFRTFL